MASLTQPTVVPSSDDQLSAVADKPPTGAPSLRTEEVRGVSPFQDLIRMAQHLLALQSRGLKARRCPRERCCKSPLAQKVPVDPERVTRGVGASSANIILSEDQLRQLLLQHFSNSGVSPPSSWRAPKELSGLHKGPFVMAGECDAQLDCHGEILSLSLSSSPNLIGLSRSVLLTFFKLRVLLLPLNGLSSFEVPEETPNPGRPSGVPATSAGCHRRGNQVELPQLRVLDLSFNELCTLDGFWSAPRLQQLCLVANHLLLLSDLAPVGPLNPKP